MESVLESMVNIEFFKEIFNLVFFVTFISMIGAALSEIFFSIVDSIK